MGHGPQERVRIRARLPALTGSRCEAAASPSHPAPDRLPNDGVQDAWNGPRPTGGLHHQRHARPLTVICTVEKGVSRLQRPQVYISLPSTPAPARLLKGIFVLKARPARACYTILNSHERPVQAVACWWRAHCTEVGFCILHVALRCGSGLSHRDRA